MRERGIEAGTRAAQKIAPLEVQKLPTPTGQPIYFDEHTRLQSYNRRSPESASGVMAMLEPGAISRIMSGAALHDTGFHPVVQVLKVQRIVVRE